MNPANCLSHIFKWLTIKCVQQAMITLQGMGFKARVLFFNEKEQWIQSMLYLNNTYNTLWNTFTILRLIWVRKFYLIVEKWHACSQLQKKQLHFCHRWRNTWNLPKFFFSLQSFWTQETTTTTMSSTSLSLSLSLFLCLSKTQSARNQSFFFKVETLLNFWSSITVLSDKKITPVCLYLSVCL